MSDMNRVFIIGRLVRDAELKYAASGTAVCRFTVACNEKRKSGEEWVDEASFFDAVLFGKTAESLEQYLVKGKQIAIDGKLKQERWEDTEGKSRSRVSVTAMNIQLLNSGNSAGGSGDGGGYAKSGSAGGYGNGGYGSGYASRGSAGGSAPPAPAPADDDGFVDDIPF